MTYINPADTRREYKRTQEAHQKPRPQPRGDTRRGDQPPPTKRSRAPDHAHRARAERPAEPHEDGSRPAPDAPETRTTARADHATERTRSHDNPHPYITIPQPRKP